MLQATLTLLETYKYAIFIPLAIVEGPIVAIIAGFLITLGLMDFAIVYVLSILGDLVGDSFLYGLGRWGKSLVYRFGHYIGITRDRLARAETYFQSRHRRSLFISKVVHGIGTAGLVAAGMFKVPYSKFITICLPITIVQSAIFITVGMLFGSAYVRISGYLNYFAGAASIVVVIVVFLLIYRAVSSHPEDEMSHK